MNKEKNVLLKLIGRTLFDNSIEIPNDVDWQKLSDLAMKHTVLPLVINSLRVQELEKVPIDLKNMWRNFSMQSLLSNEALLTEQHKVIELFEENDVPCVVLKGSSVAINYPNPELRMMGDIDLLVNPESQVKSIDLLQEIGYGNIRNLEHPHHLEVSKKGIDVEIHKQVNGVSKIKNINIRNCLESFFEKSVTERDFSDDIPTLSNDRQAVALILHKWNHFMYGGLGLRQLCDWALFIHKRMTEETWIKLEPRLKTLGLLRFTGLVTRACIDHLGLPEGSAPWAMKYNKELATEIIENILKSGNFGSGLDNINYNLNLGDSNIKEYIRFINEACKIHWPICAKYKFLLPVAPLFAYPNYRKKYKGTDHRKFHPIGMYKKAGDKQKLIKELKLFEPEE